MSVGFLNKLSVSASVLGASPLTILLYSMKDSKNAKAITRYKNPINGREILATRFNLLRTAPPQPPMGPVIGASEVVKIAATLLQRESMRPGICVPKPTRSSVRNRYFKPLESQYLSHTNAW
ncbi:hypothetical protein LQW54_001857 [Pestalotiopsis sp. IQ-011]